MRGGPRPGRGIAAGLLLAAALAAGPGGAPPARGEGGGGSPGAAPAEGQRSPADPQSNRAHGIEDKLKESAAARKTADQARMEAERRLAEGMQERERLGAEIALLRDSKLAMEGSLKRSEERTADLAERLRAAEEQARRAGAEREGESRRAAGLERRLDERAAEESRLNAELKARDGELARLQGELAGVQAERDALDARLGELRALVPAPEGGSLTLEAAQGAAAAAATGLRDCLERLQGPRDIQGRVAVREAELALHRRQFAVARVSGARSVYRVRPSDSLALIASRFYGDAGHWGEIREANRHVLDDPDRLTPGISLVIP
jgi:nucleoid-associated protein YgaU